MFCELTLTNSVNVTLCAYDTVDPSVIRTPFIRTLTNLNTIFGNYNDIHWSFAVH